LGRFIVMASLSLTSHQVRQIEKILHRWLDKLTWVALVKKIDRDLEIQTTRQTLDTYKSIKQAFDDAKLRLRGTPKSYRKMPEMSLEKADLVDKIQKAENELLGVRKQNQRLQGLLNDIRKEAENNPLLMELLVSVKRQHTVKEDK
jgi:hypothetical protein